MFKSQETLQTAARALTFRRLTPEQWRMWRRVMRRQPQWYILRQSGKRHDRWHAVAGPFCSPDDARVALNRLTSAETGRLGSAAERWQVASLPDLLAYLTNRFNANTNIPAYIKGAPEASHGQVITVLDQSLERAVNEVGRIG